MRFLLCVLALLFASIHPFLAQRDAAGVLAEMREALGGAAALDAVKTFSANGSRTLSSPMGTRRLGLEWFALLPEHFLEIRRDSTTGPMATDITYYSGISGVKLIRRTDSSLPFPEVRYTDNSPQAVAARERVAVQRQAQSFARLLLVFYGTSTTSYPLQFSYGGVAQADGKSYEVIEATAADGFHCRLHVDSATHLPAMLTWMDEVPHIVTTTSTSTVTTSNGRVVSQSPPNVSSPVIPPGNRGLAPKRWLFTNFKVQDGIKWPRVIEEEFEGKRDEIRLGSVKINPKIDARKFDIK